jgi:hypothetical protein
LLTLAIFDEKYKLRSTACYSSLQRVVISSVTGLKWAGHEERKGEKRVVYRVWWRNLRERDHLEDPEEDGRIILR